MKRLLLLAVFGILGIFYAGCDANSEEDTAGTVTLVGQVLNASTNNPVENAFVRILPYDLLYETDTEGRFQASVEIDSTMDLRLTASRNGFSSAATNVLAIAGRTVEVPTFRIGQTVAEGPVSGSASNILLLDQSTQSIGVKESGSKEVANITFQVADSLGRPVVLDHAVTVNFTLGAQPGGGEFIFPESAKTDNNGQVMVNLSSGTKSGVVQIVAEANLGGQMIRSLPVSVAIHGGMPDQRHFSVGPERFNFPGLRRFGLADPISVIVGDKYANPVKPGTAVYFTTSHGVVEGSVLTNEQGRGAVDLLSANPLPSDGVAIITARTADENQQDVADRIPVLFSGVPVVRISPSVALLNQVYQLEVTDQNKNPLVAGTSIDVRVEGTKVKAVGNTSLQLDDTAFFDGARDYNGDGIPDGAKDGDNLDFDDVRTGPGVTIFTFSAVPDMKLDEEGQPEIEAITVTIKGPNGGIEVVLTKGGAPQTSTKGATIETMFDGATLIKLGE